MTDLPTAKYLPQVKADGELRSDPKYLHETIRYLYCSFIWDKSAEGFDFWDDIARRLQSLADGELYTLPPPVDPEDWRPANIVTGVSSVGYWLASFAPTQLPNLNKIARHMAQQPLVNSGRYYAKASKKEQEAGCRFVRVYSTFELDNHLPTIIKELDA